MFERRESLSRSSRDSAATDSSGRGSRGSNSDLLSDTRGNDYEDSAARRNSARFEALIFNAFDQQALDALQTPRLPEHHKKKSDAHER
jgi:hypothetical protein